MTSKNKYIAFCETEKNICIYDQPFWLDAVCGKDNWDVFLVEKDNCVVAALPYFIKKKMGLRYITMPQLTQHNGIYVNYPENLNYEKKLDFEYSVFSEIASQIDNVKHEYYIQCFSPTVNNWQPFYWKGFSQETRYTFVLDCTVGYDEIMKNMSSGLRRDIKKAEKEAIITETDDLDLFYKINSMSFSRQGVSNPISRDLIESIYRTCKEKDCIKIMLANDQQGNTHCVGLYVYDCDAVYELCLGTDPQFRNKNFKSLLTAKAIEFACQTGRNFDFEGSMIEGIAKYNKRYGAKMVPYYCLKKVAASNPIVRTFLSLRR